MGARTFFDAVVDQEIHRQSWSLICTDAADDSRSQEALRRILDHRGPGRGAGGVSAVDWPGHLVSRPALGAGVGVQRLLHALCPDHLGVRKRTATNSVRDPLVRASRMVNRRTEVAISNISSRSICSTTRHSLPRLAPVRILE